MNAELQQIKEWAESGVEEVGRGTLLDKIEKIERRTLPKRIAKILRNVDSYKMNFEFIEDWGKDPKLGYSGWVAYTIAEALESGDTTKIKRWERERRDAT